MSNKKPYFTIITVTLNCETLIEKTIKSVLGQNFTNYEYIIIDGQSSDGTISIIEKYQDKIDHFICETDKGIYDAMNKGIKIAKGSWVLFLNAGDTLYNNEVFLNVSQTIDANLCDVAYGDIQVWRGGVLVPKLAKEPCNLHRMSFCHQSAFTKRALLENQNFDLQYKLSADFDFYKKLYHNKIKFIHINAMIVVYDMNGISNQQRLKGLKENLKIVLRQDNGFEKIKFAIKLFIVINRIIITNYLKKK